MRTFALVAVLLLATGLAFGADVDGKWQTKMPGMDGNEMTLTYNFKADGTTLTGSTVGPDGKEIPIKDGKIDGNNISFVVVVDFGGQEMTMKYSGTVAPDKIDLKFDMGMGDPMALTLKKVQ